MNEPQPLTDLPVEQPQLGIDNGLEVLEESTLDNHATEAKELKPSQIELARTSRQIEDLINQRNTAASNCSSLQQVLDDLRPAHASLNERHRALKILDTYSLMLMAVGGATISAAFYWENDTLKNFLYFAGVTTLVIGATMTLVNRRWF